MKLLVTHHAPDIDAITSVWIMKRFDPEHFSDAKIAFVDAGRSMSAEEAVQHGVSLENVTHLDTGEGEFDHHQKERAGQRICASKLAYDHVCKINPTLLKDWQLEQIVEYALQDDHFEDYFLPDAGSVRQLFTLRWIIRGAENDELHDDDSQMQLGFRMLDAIYNSLKDRHHADKEIEKGVKFSTKIGQSLGMNTSNSSAVRFAQLQGYKLVIQKDSKRGGVNIKAAPEKEIDLTPLYNALVAKDAVGNWYFHNGKHMIINNSSHSKQRPTPLSLDEVIALAKETV
jgi:hypothetical protein